MTANAAAVAPAEFNLLPTEETSAGTSFSGSRFLFRSVAEVVGVQLTEQEDSDWRALLGGAYLVDHLLDIDKVDIMPHLNSIISGYGIPELHQDTQVRFRNYMLRQGEGRQDDILSRLDTVSGLAKRQAEAKKVVEVIKVRLEEASLLTYLLSLPAEAKTDKKAREKFNRWLSCWSRCGYLLDTLKDMRLDYDNGDSGVKPSIASHTAVAAVTSREALYAVRYTPAKLLGKCAVVGFNYVLLDKKPNIADKKWA